MMKLTRIYSNHRLKYKVLNKSYIYTALKLVMKSLRVGMLSKSATDFGIQFYLMLNKKTLIY